MLPNVSDSSILLLILDDRCHQSINGSLARGKLLPGTGFCQHILRDDILLFYLCLLIFFEGSKVLSFKIILSSVLTWRLCVD